MQVSGFELLKGSGDLFPRDSEGLQYLEIKALTYFSNEHRQGKGDGKLSPHFS